MNISRNGEIFHHQMKSIHSFQIYHWVIQKAFVVNLQMKVELEGGGFGIGGFINS